MLGSVAFVLSVECACTFVCVWGGGYVWVCGCMGGCLNVRLWCHFVYGHGLKDPHKNEETE